MLVVPRLSKQTSRRSFDGMLVASPPRPSSSLRVLPRLSPAARTQIGLFGLAYLLYSAARWVTVGDLPTAQAHALWILHTERHAGVAVEASVQHGLSGTPAIWVLNHLYLAAQLVVVPGALVFLYRRSHGAYERLRNTILATWLISIPVYALYPVAPPRLAHIGLLDTITQQTGFAMDSKLTTSFYNQLAAVPSLHVGFAVAVGIAVATAVRNPLARGLALLWGPAIGLAVVATGNHFVFDIAAGLVASAVGYALGEAVARASRRPRQAAAMRPVLAEA
jgi:PAP2 superfamily